MPSKQIPAEALLELHRRLATLPPRSHERRLVMQATARLYGVSEPPLYRALAARGRPKIVRRADRGTPRVLPQEQLERYGELIAAIKVRPSTKKPRHLSTGDAIRLLEEFGLETPDGFVQAPKGRLTRTTVNRYLQPWGFDRTRLLRQPAALRFQAEHSNDCWQFDLSPSDLKAVKEPSWVRPEVGAPTLMLVSVVDDRSGVAYQEYQCVYGEDVEAARRFLCNAMAPKPVDDVPLHGIPRLSYLDNGPIAKSQIFQQVMRYWDVDVRPHMPQGKDGRRVTARSKGKVARPCRTVQEMPETLDHCHEPKDAAAAKAWRMPFLVRDNGMQPRSEPHSRWDDGRQHLPPSGVRAICSWDRLCTFAREPARRKVGIDARVSVAGVHYEVDPDLAGEPVVLWWGLFDNELYVEHGERRFGPYRPIGGPIPLHRSRAFKNTPTPRRAERLAALAVPLALPRAALEGHPHAGALAPTTEVPAIPFAAPAPLQELAYPTVLMAKRAIADELGLPLAKLSSAQRAQIDASLATTLKKTEVMAQVRAHIHAAMQGGTPW